MAMHKEDIAWMRCDVEDLWIFDKLILSKKLGYTCGPVGVDVPRPDMYIVRPCVNLMGMGVGAEFLFLEEDTDYLPTGYFWCEIFKGRHLSVDYLDGEQVLCVEGFRSPDSPIYKWDRWERVDDIIPYPSIFKKYPYLNCEFIDGKLIEAHLRVNPDFQNDEQVILPVWEGQDLTPPEEFEYVSDPDHHRVGFFVKRIDRNDHASES